MIKINEKQIKEGRKKLKEYIKGIQGSFYTNLFRSIWCADHQNLIRLIQGFGGEVFAFLEYSGQINRFQFHVIDDDKNDIYIIDGKIISKKKVTFHLEENISE